MSGNNDETKDKKKRTRSANFTPRETQILLSLVSYYKNIVENRKNRCCVHIRKKQSLGKNNFPI